MVALWTLGIYLTIPAARAIQSFVAARWGRPAFAYLVVVAAIGVPLAWITSQLRQGRRPGVRSSLWLLVVSGIYILWTITLSLGSPEESLHFVEYGFLSAIVLRALSHRLRDWVAHLVACAICAIIGTVDEIIQWLTPDRLWALGDVGLNAGSAVLAQVAIGKGIRPARFSEPAAPRSVRWLLRLGAAEVLLLGLCASNTPPRIGWYAERFPPLRFLKENESVMTEYGYRHQDPETGVFFSRFRLEELKRIDSQRGATAAAILDRFRRPGDYATFLKKYSPVIDPFVHEARVHLFRRDRYLEAVERFRGQEKLERYHYTVAYRENRILEKFFPRTLGRSSYLLSPEEVAFLKGRVDPEIRYVSRVSEDLIVRATEGQIWIGVLLVVSALMVADRRSATWGGRDRARSLTGKAEEA